MRSLVFLTLSAILLLYSPAQESLAATGKPAKQAKGKAKSSKKPSTKKSNKGTNKNSKAAPQKKQKDGKEAIKTNEKSSGKALSEKEIIADWKKRKKAITPLQLKDLVEENARLKSQNTEVLAKYKSNIDSTKKDKLDEIGKLGSRLDLLLKSGTFNNEDKAEASSLMSKLKSAQDNSQNLSVDELNTLKMSLSKIQEKYTNPTSSFNSIPADLKASEYIAILEKQLSDLKSMFSKVSSRESRSDLNKLILLLEKELSMLRDSFPKDYADSLHKGIAFQVQIGAYKNIDIAKLSKDAVYEGELHQELLNGYNQYTLRTFRSYWDADKFKKLMRVIGIKDAWIVALKDGKRVPLKDVLSAVRKQK
jgi:hypothetical protein